MVLSCFILSLAGNEIALVDIIMSRKRCLPCPDSPFFIGARSHNRSWFSVPISEAWVIYESWLYFIAFAFGVKIHSFVLMDNHFHLLATFPKNNMSEAMCYFMKETSRSINSSAGKINQNYGNRFYRTRISNDHQFLNVYKYVYRNPVEAGLVQFAEDYKYSTLHGLVGRQPQIIPIEDSYLYEDYFENLNWINQAPLEIHKKQISKALKKAAFKLPLCRFSKNKSSLESELY